jgi:lysophospholipase L1-like esterase
LARAFSVCVVLPILRAMLRHETRQPNQRRQLTTLLATFTLLVCIRVCAVPLPQPAGSSLRKLPIENAAALHDFQQALARSLTESSAEPAVTRIIHYGDSHVAADLLTGSLRQQFQTAFGNAGSGFLYAARPWNWYTRASFTSVASAGWNVDGLKLAALPFDNLLGLAGLSFTTNRAGERLQLTATGTRFEFYLLQQPQAGSVECWLDGELYHPALPLDAPYATTLFVPIEAESDGPHTLELRTITDGPVRSFGLIAENNRSGVSYDALGLNGARATRPLAWDWDLLREQLTQRAPDLIVIAYGSNEAGDTDLSLATYQRDFTELLRRFQAAVPEAALLVIAPPDRAAFTYGRWQTLPKLPGVVAAQRAAAQEADAAFWNLFQAMGGAGSIQRWATQRPPLAQADRVHLTATGYRLIADALYEELTNNLAKSTPSSKAKAADNRQPTTDN